MSVFSTLFRGPTYEEVSSDEKTISNRGNDDQDSGHFLSKRHSSIDSGLSRCSITALFALGIGILFGYWMNSSQSSSLTEFGISSDSPIPRTIFTSRHEVAFIPDEGYIGPSHEANMRWTELTSADSIYIAEPQKFGLRDPGIRAPFFLLNDPPPIAESLDNVNNFYVLNNLHQLHCVNTIRKRYNTLVYDSQSTDALSGKSIDADWITHIEHCFEYLRLSITCGDYMAFESDSPPGSPEEYWNEGLSWGVIHSCIDWEHLIQFQEQQVALYNSTWT